MSVKNTMNFSAVYACQSPEHTVLSFAASVSDVLRFAVIDRVTRGAEGQISGFQRPQMAGHIREIRDYLERPEAVLPNPIIVAFTRGIEVLKLEHGVCRISVDVTNGAPGLVVDGQQRLTALKQLPSKNFQVFVSALICRDEAELRRQFVLINNTRPLPKSLIYELLPTVNELPARLSRRSVASTLTAKLNFEIRSPFHGRIYQHTNPAGTYADTAIQKVIMNSLNDGVMRELMHGKNGEEKCFELMSEFYHAVGNVFSEAWKKQRPTTSRLVHGAGIQAMGYVMEILSLLDGARSRNDFAQGMECLKGRTAWTEGQWDFGNGDVRHWNSIQNISRDVIMLAQYLTGLVRADIRARRVASTRPNVRDDSREL
ncbi:DGQHR domain-containing protein [Azospirillum oryzae]|uniref:DGQHR domain-containing protein n=1 Tax=Azospirillum oryzae TaxID=286727 RepID=A0A1X7GJT1_9PROT|nr:DGQHR domain-containing protein DpdB [Azospirillum oryzae]SMF70780.1 DGQHR domain-containing protein [Azospirillum oryzae]